MSNTLALFWNLAAPEREARINASSQLVETLVAQSVEGDAVDDVDAEAIAASDVILMDHVSDAEAEAAEQRIDELNSSDTSYAIRRLVRGLASPRESARIGFAVALSELLSRLSSVSAHDVIVLLLKYSIPRGNMNGQEARDLHFARLFGIYALVRSGLLYSSHSSLPTFQRAFRVLLSVAAYKSWLSEPCGWVLVELVRSLDLGVNQRPAWADDALAWVADQLCASRHLSPETLALLMTLVRIAPSLNVSERMIPPLKNSSIFAPANLPLLASVLREAVPMHWNAETPPPKAGSWSTHLPFVWDVILDMYLQDDVPAGSAPFPDFFRVVVDESLFAPHASAERKSWGFQVLHRILPHASADVLPFLFTPHVMRTWVNQLSVSDRLLHSMAHKTVALMSDAVKRCPTAGIALVTQLTGEHGRQNFDRVTNTKTIESILSSLDAAGIQRYLAYLRGVIHAPTSSDNAKALAMQRQSAFDQMLGLIRSHLVKSSGGWVRDVLVFFAGHGYYTVKKAPLAPWNTILQVLAVPLSSSLREVCRLRLQACLIDLPEPDEHGTPWPLVVMDILDAMNKDLKHFTSTALPIAKERIERARAVLTQIQKATKKSTEPKRQTQMQAFQVLLVSVILVTFEDTDDSPDLVEPLADAAQLLFFEKRKEKHELGGMELFTDALVELLEISSAFLRAMTCQVFAKFSGSMTRESLDHLVDQLGMNDDKEEEEEEEHEHEHEHEHSEDQEIEELEEDEEEEDDEDDDEEDEENFEADVDPVLRSRVEEAFKASGMANDDDEDDLVMNDDQMAQLDDKLADIFQQHTSSKRKEREVLQRDTALFHNKILDLLDIYAKEQSGNVLVLRLVAPLLALARGSGDVSPQVANRAGQILRQRVCKPKDLPRGTDADMDQVEHELADTHALLRATQDAKLADLAATVSHLYTKVLIRHGYIKAVVRIFQTTLEDFLERKASPVRSNFLLEAIRRYPELGWGLRDALLDGCRISKAARAFRQVQMFTMLQAVLRQQQHEESRQASVSDGFTFITHVREAIFETVEAACAPQEGAAAMNAQRLKDVLRFALQAVRITAHMTSGDGAQMHACWPSAELDAMLGRLQASERFKNSTSLHSIVKEMQALLRRADESTSLKQKRQADDTKSEQPKRAT